MATDPMTSKAPVYVSLPCDALLSFNADGSARVWPLLMIDLKKKFAALMKEHSGDRPFYCHFTSVTVRPCCQWR